MQAVTAVNEKAFVKTGKYPPINEVIFRFCFANARRGVVQTVHLADGEAKARLQSQPFFEKFADEIDVSCEPDAGRRRHR